jgi:hypothetical protein
MSPAETLTRSHKMFLWFKYMGNTFKSVCKRFFFAAVIFSTFLTPSLLLDNGQMALIPSQAKVKGSNPFWIV